MNLEGARAYAELGAEAPRVEGDSLAVPSGNGPLEVYTGKRTL